MPRPSLHHHPSLESSSSVGDFSLRPSLFDAREDFIERVAPLGMGAIFFGSFSLAPQDVALSRQALYKLSFLHRHFLQTTGLRIVVQRKTAILSGPAISSDLLLMAELLARQIEGIVNVENETEKSTVALSPLEKARESIQLLFATDQTLRSGVRISLIRDRVTLEGQVGSAGQKTWAEKLAEAVTEQVDSKIEVSSLTLAHAAPVTSIALDNESLQALVMLRLKLVRDTAHIAVRVQANRGALSLQGKVRSEHVRQRAENIARSTLGLTELRSSLSIET